MSAILKQLDQNSIRMLNIQGIAGMGKTTVFNSLLKHIDVRRLYSNGIVLIQCRDLTDTKAFEKKLNEHIKANFSS